MPNIEIEVICDGCGGALLVIVRGNVFKVAPCPMCVIDGYNDGYDEARKKYSPTEKREE